MTKRLFVETYGCQMNEADTELIAGLMRKGLWACRKRSRGGHRVVKYMRGSR